MSVGKLSHRGVAPHFRREKKILLTHFPSDPMILKCKFYFYQVLLVFPSQKYSDQNIKTQNRDYSGKNARIAGYIELGKYSAKIDCVWGHIEICAECSKMSTFALG